jgi:glycerol-3-phosphate dehydrogenase (NAD(P)+)
VRLSEGAKLKLAVLGCGRWGSFHLWYGDKLGFRTMGWEPAKDPVIVSLMKNRGNDYLKLPDGVGLTLSLEKALEGADLVVVSCPAQSFRQLAGLLSRHDLTRSDVSLCMKGLEETTGKRLSEICAEAGVVARSVCAWVGPGHPQEFVKGVPGCMIVASEDEGAAERLSRRVNSSLLRMYHSRDIIGCEIGAAAKNVIGIAAGMLDGRGMAGLKGALMARGPQEFARLVSAAGGDWRSVYGLSHLGDYEATLFSPWSRNSAWGEAFVRGGASPGLAEGVPSCGALLKLAGFHGVELPITEAVFGMIRGVAGFDEAVEPLFGRPMKEECSRKPSGEPALRF